MIFEAGGRPVRLSMITDLGEPWGILGELWQWKKRLGSPGLAIPHGAIEGSCHGRQFGIKPDDWR